MQLLDEGKFVTRFIVLLLIQFLYFDSILTHRQGLFTQDSFPHLKAKQKTWLFVLPELRRQQPFASLITKCIPRLELFWSRNSCSMLPLLHLRGGREQPDGKHHRLGAGAVSGGVWRRGFQARHFSLRLRAAASSGVSGALCGEFEESVAAYSAWWARPRPPPSLPRRGRSYASEIQKRIRSKRLSISAA